MKSKGLTIATIVLAALLGLLYWSNRHKPADTTETIATPTPSEPAPVILKLNEADINRIELKKKGADQIVVTKDSNGKWQITAPRSMSVDESVVTGMLSSLSSLNSERLVEEKAANPARYGLAEPAVEVTVTDKNNAAHKLLLGDDTPTGSGAYVQLAGDPRVFTIASFTKGSLDKGLNDLRDKRLITADTDKVTRIELIGKQSIEFSRDKEQWQILKPKPLRADGVKVEELLRKITEARMDTTDTDASKTTSAFAAGSSVATAKVTTDMGTQQIEVKKDKDNYYAKSSVADGVYKVASDLGEALDKKLSDFRNKKVFDFGFNDPSKIEIQDGSKTYSLSKNGEDWTSAEGKKFDKTTVQPLVEKLGDLTASDFADTGFGSSALQITVTSSDGKHVEKVALGKGLKNTLARREGESSFYVLEEKTLDDIEKLLTSLKSI
jgi:hypothetical protein